MTAHQNFDPNRQANAAAYLAWLPSVEQILQNEQVRGLAAHSHTRTVCCAREVVANWRARLQQAEADLPASREELRARICREVAQAVQQAGQPTLKRVVNGTGIVLHTNLGRAPLSAAAVAAVNEVNAGYCNLELSLATGERSQRYQNVENLLLQLTGAEACLVVNNNAAAVLLALDTLAAGREGVISRGELVEIGGSFRVPAIMEKSCVTLHEIGTTNKTYLEDYRAAINEHTGILLSVHPSNFSMQGFVHSVPLADLAALGAERGIPVLYDWGAGCLANLQQTELGEQQQIRDLVATGVDVICFSGDKLLGGPQAGILVGKKSYINACRNNQLTRALRVDKMVLAALEATLTIYLDGDAVAQKEIPALEMLLRSPGELKQQAQSLLKQLAPLLPAWQAEVVAVRSKVGGGSLPGVELPSYAVSLRPPQGGEAALAARLRSGEPAIMSYLANGGIMLDVRTLLAGDEQRIVAAFAALEE